MVSTIILSSYLRIMSFQDVLLYNVAIHVNKAKKIETHGWCETTQHHSRKYQRVLICLMMGG